MCATCQKIDWELEKACSAAGFPQECAPVECCNFAPIIDPDLINRSSDPLCMYGDEDMPSLCVSPELFDRVLSQPAVPGEGDLVVARPVSSVKGDSVCTSLYFMASGVTDVENRFPLTTAARSMTGGYRCSGWLKFLTREAESVAPPISAGHRMQPGR